MAPQTTDTARTYWNSVYDTKEPDEVSWYEAVPRVSVDLITQLRLSRDAAIVDVGGGTSGLGRELVATGYTDVTVADVSDRSLELARANQGSTAAPVRLERADVRGHDFGRRVDLWHDRAVLHFMTQPDDLDGYLDTLRRTLRPGGHAIISTFAPDGPTECSGLPVCRYSSEDLARMLGEDEFDRIRSLRHVHRTPSGNPQAFVYLASRRRG